MDLLLVACTCVCIAGSSQPVSVCDRVSDVPAICAPRICSIAPPTVRPIEPIVLPPLGTSECRNERVLNDLTNQYEWVVLCS